MRYMLTYVEGLRQALPPSVFRDGLEAIAQRVDSARLDLHSNAQNLSGSLTKSGGWANAEVMACPLDERSLEKVRELYARLDAFESAFWLSARAMLGGDIVQRLRSSIFG